MADKWKRLTKKQQDGHVYFTNEGSGKFEDGRWYLANTGGSIPSCADWGREDAEIEPSYYLPVKTLWPQ